jgi:hypothetical protein
MPAPVLTYDTLIQDIIRYSERDDQSFVEQIPRMIMLAEQEIAAQVKTLWELVVVETTLLSGSQGATLEKPARWRKTVSMKINGQPVLLRGQDYVAQAQNELNTGQPKYYSDYDYNHWAFAPIPDDEYSVEIIYYNRVQPLADDNQENLITREAPQALLFGSLLQAQPYLKSPDKLQIWSQLYKNSMGELTKEDSSRRIDRNTSVQEPQ